MWCIASVHIRPTIVLITTSMTVAIERMKSVQCLGFTIDENLHQNMHTDYVYNSLDKYVSKSNPVKTFL